MNKRFLIISAGLVILLLLVIGVSMSQTLATGSLDLTIQPTDATVTIDAKPADPSRAISLKTGQHTVTIKREGFTTQTFITTITAGKTTAKTVILKVYDTIGQAYVEAHPEYTAQAEGEAGKAVEERGDHITQNNPLIQLLPYRGSTFSISVGISKAHPDDRDAVGIYISAPTDTDKTKARNWIKAQGYNPDAYEIIYE